MEPSKPVIGMDLRDCTFTCPECDRVLKMTEAADWLDYQFGHDCEAPPKPLLYRVGTMRAYGLRCKWGRNRAGKPTLIVNDINSKYMLIRANWYFVDDKLWALMQEIGVMPAFRKWINGGEPAYQQP